MWSNKSPYLLDPVKSTWESYLPKCGRIVLQKRDMGYEKVQRYEKGECYVQNYPGKEKEEARNCRDLLKRAKELQAEETHFTR